MDDASASLEHSTSKRQKVFRGNESEDRISNLPDAILHCILSFLPTIYAVRTSVLSTRWKCVWTSIHNLDFCDELWNFKSMSKGFLKKKKGFIDFVDRLLRHNQVLSIHKFRLDCKEYDAFQYNQWMTTLIKRKVQEVVIHAIDTCPHMFSYSLFTCRSLRVLKLEMDVSINIPDSSICFPNLKVLHLTNVALSSDQWLHELSFSCPVLEEFNLIRCTWLRIKIVNISAPTLQMLKIEDWLRDDNLDDCEIKIYAESLISFDFKESYRSYQYTLCNLSSLIDVSIDDATSFGETVHHLDSLLRGISNVKNLQITDRTVKVLSLPYVSAYMLTLSRLIHLTVRGTLAATDINGRQLIEVLSNMPNIERLFFRGGLGSFTFKGHGRIVGKTPQCFLPNLNFVDFRCFSWKEKEMWLVKFLMKSAKATDGLTVKLTNYSHFDRKDLAGRKDKLIKQLKMCARDSNCVLEFA